MTMYYLFKIHAKPLMGYYLLVTYCVLFSISGHHLWVCVEKMSIINPGSDGNYLDNSDQMTPFMLSRHWTALL